MNVLVACEESQRVCIAFRKRGIRAFSCDIQSCSGGHPEYHICEDVRKVLKGHITFTTEDGKKHHVKNWNLIIAHPPCTYMTKCGARWMFPVAGKLSKERYAKAMKAKEFFMMFYNLQGVKVAIENPVPLKVVGLPPYTQVIQPYEFGDPYSKKTLLWLKGLNPLRPTKILTNYVPWICSNTGGVSRGQSYSRGVAKTQREASQTFQGIAEAMAEQWGAH